MTDNSEFEAKTMSSEKKILIVDDDESLAGFLQTLLSNGGYRVESVFGGAEALRRIKTFHPELVLMDIGLPDMSGLEVLRQIRAQAEFKETIVMLITGTTGLEMKIEGFNTGANDYVSKPVDPRELLLKIERFLKTVEVQKDKLVSKQKETLQTIVNTLAHELSSPLAAIRHQIRLCGQDQQLESLRNSLNSIEVDAKRMEEIIMELQSAVRFVAKEPIPGVHLLDLEESSKGS
jgi:DNA-binding response OmpR family regulator